MVKFFRTSFIPSLLLMNNHLATDASLNSSQQDFTKCEQEDWALLCQALKMSNEFIYLR